MGRVNCSLCKEEYFKDTRHINENLKLGHNFFCSPVCQYSFKNKQQELVCKNRGCKNKFKRAPHSISIHNFCSHSCAAIFNNFKKWGPKKPKRLLTKAKKTKIRMKAHRNYWQRYWLTHGESYIISKIQNFVRLNGRIPVKREMWGIYHPARKFFGTWNNAIEAAGFKPNPILFAKHHLANDGHICDSLAEKLIDDYLFQRKIVHERNVPYPKKEYTADFKIGNRIIEYFGLAGEHKRYDQLRRIKQRIVKRYKLQFTEIYPKDLYPHSKLSSILQV